MLDPKQQWAGPSEASARHRVRNNLPGTPEFCPLVFRTPALDALVALNLADRARAIAAEVPADLLARTAAFLLLKDLRASYVIEGENPPRIAYNGGAAPSARPAASQSISTSSCASNGLSSAMTASLLSDCVERGALLVSMIATLARLCRITLALDTRTYRPSSTV